jgi:AcrR family transcriptional regulator
MSRTGRPPLTERRKAATRLEIAREAVRLFTAGGVAATSAEDIAAAAGISVRTLWRYFPTKERCVLPLLTTGIENTARVLRAWAPGAGVAELVDDIDQMPGDMPPVLALVRLTRTEPALRAVWLQAHDDAEPVFAAALAERAGVPHDDLATRIQAALINVALRVAVEHYAWHAEQPESQGLKDAVRTALEAAAQGLPR